jgi:muramoyltetrapeptide carboxypeptidase
VILPAKVAPGDTIAVVAPSSPFETVLGFRGLAFLRERYEVLFDRAMFSRTGYLAGDDARRRTELEGALFDPRVKAIVAARGGYGASRFVHDIDWNRFAANPKWIVGFSDITAIHLELARAGVASLHAPHLTSLGRSDQRVRASFVSALEAPSTGRTFSGLRTLSKGTGRGSLVGGNLTLLHATAAAGRLALPRGAVLFIEDVTERPYRIDRMLTTLETGGHFASLSGIVAGEFTSCDPGPDRVTVDEVLEERLGRLGIPVATGLPVGHGAVNEPLPLGLAAELEATSPAASLALGAA